MKSFVSYLLVALAASIDAILDSLKDHFSVSIFKGLNPNFWNPNVSWATSFTALGVHWDAWHLTKFGLLASIFLAIQFSKQVAIKWWINILIYFAIWWIFFEVFYSHILVL
jgi:hypothetical protein